MIYTVRIQHPARRRFRIFGQRRSTDLFHLFYRIRHRLAMSETLLLDLRFPEGLAGLFDQIASQLPVIAVCVQFLYECAAVFPAIPDLIPVQPVQDQMMMQPVPVIFRDYYPFQHHIVPLVQPPQPVQVVPQYFLRLFRSRFLCVCQSDMVIPVLKVVSQQNPQVPFGQPFIIPLHTIRCRFSFLPPLFPVFPRPDPDRCKFQSSGNHRTFDCHLSPASKVNVFEQGIRGRRLLSDKLLFGKIKSCQPNTGWQLTLSKYLIHPTLSFCINASCRTFEKFTPCLSASAFNQKGIVQFFLTALLFN